MKGLVQLQRLEPHDPAYDPDISHYVNKGGLYLVKTDIEALVPVKVAVDNNKNIKSVTEIYMKSGARFIVPWQIAELLEELSDKRQENRI